jgi:hypothetical protein
VLSQFLFSEAETLAATARDLERVCCNVERHPPSTGEGVEVDRVPGDVRTVLAPVP